MPRQQAPLFSLRATGLLGGHRRGALAPKLIVRTVYPVADSIMYGSPSELHDSNDGDLSTCQESISYQGGDKDFWYRSIIKFDLRSFIGQTFTAASISVFVDALSDTSSFVRLSRCTRPEVWREMEVTWNEFATGQAWTAGGGDFDDVGPPAAILRPTPSVHGWLKVNGLLPLVSDALTTRDGWLSLIGRLTDESPGDNAGLRWHSKEHTSTNRPFLTLVP